MNLRVNDIAGRGMCALLAGAAVAGCASSNHLASSPTPSGVAGTTSTGLTPSPGSSNPPSLSAVVAALPLPPGTVARPASEASQAMIEVGANPRTRHASGYWVSPLSQAQTVAWFKGHLVAPWTGDFSLREGTDDVGQYAWAMNAAEDGPNLTISVHAQGAQSTVLVDAWAVPLAAKTTDQVLTGVTSVTASVTSNVGGPVLGSATWTGAKAARLAADVNGLPVDPGLAGSCTEGAPLVDLRFVMASGVRTYHVDRNCRVVQLVHDPSAPGLAMSTQLWEDLKPVDALSTTGLVAVSMVQQRGGANDMFGVGPYGGTVVITDGTGHTVRTLAIVAGKRTLIQLKPGNYSFTGSTPGRRCVVATSPVALSREMDVEILCR